MGNKIKRKTVKKIIESFVAICFILAFSSFVFITYPTIEDLFKPNQIEKKHYNPSIDIGRDYRVGLSNEANGIPVLMYHGVTEEYDTVNTTIDNFIKQMEALKVSGYQTIKINDLYEYMEGRRSIPEKSFLITFDDGRKDSYYPTIEVLKKLGFTAVLFEATGPALEGNSFYLTYDELKEVAASGVWEIQAHGRNSHKKVWNGPDGMTGRYLTSRVFDYGQLESKESYYKRVEQDYVNNIQDIERLLGYTPKFIAIPLNDYGYNDNSNVTESLDFNKQIVKKYFNMAFVQANDTVNNLEFYDKYYNSPGDDLYSLKRIEVQNMSPVDLIKILKDGEPDAIPEFWSLDTKKVGSESRVQYGKVESLRGIHIVKTNAKEESAKIYYGDSYWKDYSIEVTMRRASGRSASLLTRVSNDNNIAFGVTDNGLFLRQTVDNKEKDLMPPVLVTPGNIAFTLKLEIKGNRLNAYYNGHLYYQNVIVKPLRGHIGVKLWSDTLTPVMEIHKLEFKKIE